MQRKLLIALIGIALASVLFVGLGVLLFAQVGARAEARDQVLNQLEALRDVTPDGSRFQDLDGPQLQRLQRAFGSNQLLLVLVSPQDGSVSTIRGRGQQQQTGPELSLELASDQVEELGQEGVVLLDRRNSVIGLLVIDGVPPRGGRQVAFYSEADVATIGGQARLWFILSALAVLTGAALVASALAKRLVSPVREIDVVTQRIAGGDLTARVNVAGTDELAALGQSVNSMATDLQRSRLLEQQFLMSVSHDLRTPLSAIQGYAEALTDGAIDRPDEAGRIISNHAGRLNRLVGDLLDLARLDAHQFRLHPELFDLTDLAGRLVGGLQPRAAEDGVTLTIDSKGHEVLLENDPDRVSQVLSNLLDNALKFARATVSVSISVSDETSGGVAIVQVTDDGVGISEADLPHVFERLYVTAQAPRRSENSSGLGLAIVRDLCHAMKGTVTVSSASQVGTTFTVSLPVAA